MHVSHPLKMSKLLKYVYKYAKFEYIIFFFFEVLSDGYCVYRHLGVIIYHWTFVHFGAEDLPKIQFNEALVWIGGIVLNSILNGIRLAVLFEGMNWKSILMKMSLRKSRHKPQATKTKSTENKQETLAIIL